MKSSFLKAASVLMVLGVALCGQAFAMPSDAESNTAQLTKLFPEGFGLEAVGLPVTLGFGSTADYVIDRNFDEGIDIDEGIWYGGNVYWDPLENVHLSTFFGVADFTLGNVRINNDTTTRMILKTNTDFAVGGGGKVDILQFDLLPDLPKMNLFASGGYRWTSGNVTDVTSGSFNAVSQALNVEVNEWQATLGVSQKFDNPLSFIGWNGFSAVPYVGVQYNDATLNVSGTSVLPNDARVPNQSVKTGARDSDNVVGVATGLQLIGFSNQLSVSVEGRFITETSVSLNGHFRW